MASSNLIGNVSPYFVPVCHYTSRLVGCVLLCFIFTACDSQEPAPVQTPPPNEIIDLSQSWQAGDPTTYGFNPDLLQQAYKQAGQVSNLRSLLVIRNGRLIAEEYFEEAGRQQLNHVRSVTKSVVSILIGIAIEQGLIDNTSVTLADLIHEEIGVVSEEQQAITLEHLLTMRGGFEWFESGGTGFNDWVTASDQVNFLLDKPVSNAPGTRFNYNSAAVHLLSVVLSDVAEGLTTDFAEENLFEPLRIKMYDWTPDNRGFPNGGAGLQLRPRDMAKMGQLMLQEGRSGDVQVVPEEWVRRSIEVQAPLGFNFGAINDVSYGYLWWLIRGQEYDAFLGWGYGGQFIYGVPDLNLLVVTTSVYRVGNATSDEQEKANLDVIVNHVLPAIEK